LPTSSDEPGSTSTEQADAWVLEIESIQVKLDLDHDHSSYRSVTNRNPSQPTREVKILVRRQRQLL
jgi:hypothetical protein